MQYPKILFWNEKTIEVDGGLFTVSVFALRNKNGTQFQVEFQREGDFEFFVEKIPDSQQRWATAGAELAVNRDPLRDANYPSEVVMSVNGNDLRNAWVPLLRFAADELEKQAKEN